VLKTLVERCLELRQLRAVASRELTKLRMAQSRLLPQAAPQHPDWRLAFRYRPFYFATGDYHDFFPQPDGSLVVFVGDSTGHGPSACMLMATMRTLLRTHLKTPGDPGLALSGLNRMLHSLIPSDLFMTAVYLVLGRDGSMRWAAAGQHPPLRVPSKGDVGHIDLAAGGLPLGIDPDEQYRTTTWRIQPGERTVLFTDGIFEATNRIGNIFGLARVRSSLAKLGRDVPSTEGLLDGLLDEVKVYMEGSDFEDDFTLLAIERR
jgi:sigma-B regulation protein RsbU (phosphoserine phosphatase)